MNARPVSVTIESGFVASRSVVLPTTHEGPDRSDREKTQEVFERLAAIAVKYPGIALYKPYIPDAGQDRPRGLAVRVVKPKDVVANAHLLGHLDRGVVYSAIRRDVDSFAPATPARATPRVKVCGAHLLQPQAADGSGGVLSLRLEGDLNRQRYRIKSTLAELAEVPVDELKWSDYSPNPLLAHLSADTPPEAGEAMLAVVEEYESFYVGLNHGVLIPRMNEQPTPAGA